MARREEIYDVCVVGAGIEGSSTARYLASRKKKTLLLEQVHANVFLKFLYSTVDDRTNLILIQLELTY